jgi:hypothetical protein
MVGSVAASSTTGGLYEGAPDVLSFGRVGYVAVSETDVALVRTKTGAFKMKISDEVATARTSRYGSAGTTGAFARPESST